MMVRLLLGSIALGAVGYGIKEYCDQEGCPWDDISSDDCSYAQQECDSKISRLQKEIQELKELIKTQSD